MKNKGDGFSGVRRWKRAFFFVTATLFGSGYFPLASGTVGSFVSLPVGALGAANIVAGVIIAGGLFFLGVAAAEYVAREVGEEDPSIIVIDEAVGMILSVIGSGVQWEVLLAGFLLFRFFDVLKPFPCRRLERLPGGWGIMADDVMAGIYSRIVLGVLLSAGYLGG
ncbi:MAG: phosphatidylglycerophosphatase A [Candidatus Hydrogenedentota bacterium]|nr:MAG: phosphatidylglycerophosphatase A [Candidatus Hydrogenedentota bacterium]